MRKKTKAPAVPAITGAEWIVMRVVWEQGPVTAKAVVEALATHEDWKPKTIQTLLRRLTDKGALDYVKQGREFVFRAVAAERDCQLEESRSFLQRVFGGGKIAPFLAAFVEQEALSPADVRELRRILGEEDKK